MPSDFPRSPKFLKGALVAYKSQLLGVAPNIIVFQYNPAQLSRTLTHRTGQAETESDVGAAKSETFRTSGPPVETIDITVEIDAADQLAEPQKYMNTVINGLHSALAALELLMYPTIDQFMQRSLMAIAGSVEIDAMDIPLVLFIWGRNRVLPVRLTSFSVTEQEFDQQLNPIRAEVRLGMKVMSYVDLQEASIGHGIYIAFQTQKELLAQLNLINNIDQISGLLPV